MYIHDIPIHWSWLSWDGICWDPLPPSILSSLSISLVPPWNFPSADRLWHDLLQGNPPSRSSGANLSTWCWKRWKHTAGFCWANKITGPEPRWLIGGKQFINTKKYKNNINTKNHKKMFNFHTILFLLKIPETRPIQSVHCMCRMLQWL